MKKVLEILSISVASVVFTLVFMLCLLTPEKTKYNTYTDPYKYWTSDAYLCENFDYCERSQQ